MSHPWPILTRRGRLADTREWFEKHAGNHVGDRYAGSLAADSTWGDVRDAVAALGDNPDLDAVDALTGEPSWTRQQCHECHELRDGVIRLGEDPPDYDFDTIDICLECLGKAVAQLDGEC